MFLHLAAPATELTPAPQQEQPKLCNHQPCRSQQRLAQRRSVCSASLVTVLSEATLNVGKSVIPAQQKGYIHSIHLTIYLYD